ncbi:MULTISPECIES: hypothetical protein [unclassified Rhizobium]|uniref:hypothetical protein n=1 Tax=unclassified Rhizobium TaxID=2613769 RepID=UPI000DDC705B|nr:MULTISPECIES: hypothetical protein [unclassified Rhizobium]MBB3288446.1 hypothetical protein [Rhizobium sp. BK252]MBB3403417.1 hypothetical protein [Rhizobium sp. BK289]MBB3415992.1 hypothetical protein [Rhizobium sp. BK284]MBB3483880.1 hypothetical protein [Rhizobium sp. BK347]MDK4722141.1 hypothetical protein [Rhizobium sp. CNPSo 3968]
MAAIKRLLCDGLDSPGNENKIGTYSILRSAPIPTAQRIEITSGQEDFVQAILDAHGGDALAALRSVIADAAFLHDQLETASLLIGNGLVRGWKPKFQREA